MSEKEEGKKENEASISDAFGGSLNILGMKVDLGKLFEFAENSGELAYNLEKFRSELEGAGGKPVKVGGYIRTRPIVGEKTGWQPGEHKRKEAKTVYAEKEFEGKLEPLTDVFDEGDKIRVLAEIPFHYKTEDVKLEYERKNGGGELTIKAGEYERFVQIKDELAAELIGKVNLRSFKSGIVNAELPK